MLRHRTIWISDVHLGTSACQAGKLLEFLKENESDYLFLVGDIIDFWSIESGGKWTSEHNTVVQKILKKARHGTKVYYIPGNHDECLRAYCGFTFGEIEVHRDFTHMLKDGRKIFITHGDDFDIVTKYHSWITRLGDKAYTFLLWANKYFRVFNKKFSLSQFLKYKVKTAVSFISDYENSVLECTKSNAVDGVLCGHIHHAEMRMNGNMLYMNTGDWVESCTAIIETHDGELKLVTHE
jgi:UDP-2,3-diacylglucosamine pyrophosphatase LpxH